MRLSTAQIVPSFDTMFNNVCSSTAASICPNCLDSQDTCSCDWQISQLDASYSIYTTLNDDNASHKLDNLNCGGIPTRTTPTLTPTTLRTIAADIIGLPGSTEDFAVAASAVSDLHHLVSSSCPVIVSSSGTTERLTSEIQDRQNVQNLGNQNLNLQNLNNQHISVNNLQNHQLVNDDNLNQQHNDYKNSFRQAGFVPPLVLQINSSNLIQQPSSLTVLVNSNNNSNYTFNEKDSSNTVSTSHWQGAVVTENPQRVARNVTKRSFSDEDDDFDSPEDNSDSSETCSVKATNKKNTKSNKSNSKMNNKSTTNNGRQKNNRILSNEEEERRQIRRERNKLAAARCRKRRMDHTNELLEETEQLEDKRLRLQVEIQSLRQQKTDLQQMLTQHRCVININHLPVSNEISNIDNTLDSSVIPKHEAIILNNSLSTNKVNTIQENIKNDIDNIDNIIKCENQLVNDNKDDIHLIPTTVLHQSIKRKPNSLLQLNFRNNKKISENDSNGVVLLNFDSLMDGGSGLTPVCGNVQNQIQHDSSETKQ